MNSTRTFLLLLSVLLLTQCLPPQEKKITEVKFDLSNPKLQELYNFQDMQMTDSLIAYFSHKDPTYRYAAAMAFASHKDKSALDSLVPLLQDEVNEVKIAAAYAIGQLGEERVERALVSTFLQDDSTGVNQLFNATVLEAVGKCASAKYLKSISTISTYVRSDTLLLEGQAWGIYRFALREMIDPNGTERMISFLTKSGYPQSVRKIAANYLYRAKGIQLDEFIAPLSKAFVQADDPDIRMTLAIALGKINLPAAKEVLLNQFTKEKDYRVKCNIIRALGNYEYKEVKPFLFESLNDENHHVSKAVANYFYNHGVLTEAPDYWRKARDTTLHWQTKVGLYKAANKHLYPFSFNTREAINRDLKIIFQKSNNTYEKAEVLKAMSAYGKNYNYIWEQGFVSRVPVIQTSCITSLGNIVRDPNFKTLFGYYHKAKKKEIVSHLIEAIRSGDAGMVYEAAMILKEKELDFKTVVDSSQFLQEALGRLELPREIETYNALEQAIDFFNGDTDSIKEPKKPKYNHPIVWDLVTDVDNNTRAIIKTNQGDITLRFLPDAAPGTVANFIQLANSGFYNDKFFHRLVSNFVAQTGCPRGDGFGSLNYTIRSELPPLHYDKEGYVGMASAGNHTECTQWFITHSPTPHLDGNYTIFAEVVKGMDVVHQLEEGDMINELSISK